MNGQSLVLTAALLAVPPAGEADVCERRAAEALNAVQGILGERVLDRREENEVFEVLLELCDGHQAVIKEPGLTRYKSRSHAGKRQHRDSDASRAAPVVIVEVEEHLR